MATELTQLKSQLHDVENQIETCLQKPACSIESLFKQFQNFKEQLDKIENKSTVEYKDLEFYYHALYAAYLRSIGNESEALLQDKLSGKYEKLRRNSNDVTLGDDANPDVSKEKVHPYSIDHEVAGKVQQTAITYLKYLYEKIKISETKAEKSDMYRKLGQFYTKEAQNDMALSFMNSLPYWMTSRDNFSKSLDLDGKNVESIIGYANCLLNLSKFDAMLKFLSKYNGLTELTQRVDYCLLRAKAHRNQRQYKEAETHLQKIVDKEPGNVEAQYELKIVKGLLDETLEKRVEEYQKFKLDHVLQARQRDNDNQYRILSIDGGGIRGVIPAVWLCEIEKRTHKPISQLFDLLAGTSTGGIISGALSAPQTHGGVIPLFRAYDVLDIYMHKGAELFTKPFLGISLFSSKYTDKGRLALLKEYFGDRTLSHSLNDLVIPACNEENLISTYVFNRQDATNDPFKNDTYVDALMATSAAPTYFPSYKIPGKGLFNDGGVHVNNPSSLACCEAVRYGIPREKLFVLSLGTGACVPDPLTPTSKRGLLFWADHLKDVALQAQIGNTDIYLSNIMGDQNYKRWQVWLENPITLDDYGKDNVDALFEYARQFMEELDASDDNSINRLAESLVKDL